MTSTQIELIIAIAASFVMPAISQAISYKVFKTLLDYRMGLAETKQKDFDDWKTKHEEKHMAEREELIKKLTTLENQNKSILEKLDNINIWKKS